MRLSIIALVVALALPAAATAKNRTIAPPGNSGVQQYVETVPTAHGGKPSTTFHGGGSGHSGGGGGVSGGGGGTSGGGGGSTGSPISSATQKALIAQGTAGQAAAALAIATAPNVRNGHKGAGQTTGSGGASGPAVTDSLSSVSHATSASPVSAIFKALTGSSSSGGMGALLPIILIVCVLGFATLAIVRRRRTTT